MISSETETETEYTFFQKSVFFTADMMKKHLSIIDYATVDHNGFTLYTYSDEEFRNARRSLGGKWEKVKNWDDQMILVQSFSFLGSDMKVSIHPPSGTCTKVQVGTETKLVEKITRRASKKMVLEEVPVYKIECSGVLEEPEEGDFDE